MNWSLTDGLRIIRTFPINFQMYVTIYKQQLNSKLKELSIIEINHKDSINNIIVDTFASNYIDQSFKKIFNSIYIYILIFSCPEQILANKIYIIKFVCAYNKIFCICDRDRFFRIAISNFV